LVKLIGDLLLPFWTLILHRRMNGSMLVTDSLYHRFCITDESNVSIPLPTLSGESKILSKLLRFV